MSGFGWLVFQGKNAIHVSRLPQTQSGKVNGTTLPGQKFLPDVFRRNTGHIAAAVDRSLKKMVLIVTDWNERTNQGGWELDDVSRWLLGQTFIPNTNQPYKLNGFEVKDACFFDQGRTTEIYLPHQPRNQKLPILRNWARGEQPCIGAGCRHRPWPPDQSGGYPAETGSNRFGYYKPDACFQGLNPIHRIFTG